MRKRRIDFTVALFAISLAPACGTRYGDPVGLRQPDAEGMAEVHDASADAPVNVATDAQPDRRGDAPLPQGAAFATLPEFCTVDGWCGSNLTFSAVWGSSSDDVWVTAKGLGDNSTASAVLHWDGAEWRTELGGGGPYYYTTEQSDLEAIWGTGPADVWVAGSCGNFLHWDGVAWKETYVGCNNQLKAIWGSSRDDAWAVGDAGAILHFDGTTWERLSGPDVPAPRITTANLTGLWGSGASDVWAVGDAGVILHWNGSAWSQYQDAVGGTPTLADLKAVWGSAAGDVWAVGSGGLILRWNGTAWSIAPDRVPSVEDLRAIWGSGPSDVWVAGAAGTLLHQADGAWYAAPPKTAESLLAVWGNQGELWAMGERGAALHWDRTAWLASPARPVRNDLFAVSALGPSDVWVGGSNGIVAHHDGASWSQVSTGEGDINGIWVDDAGGGVFMAGDRGKVLTCFLFESFPSCSNQAAAGAPDVKAVWGFSALDVWFGGAGGSTWHYTDGGRFLSVATPVSATIRSIWGPGPDDVWAATDSDQVLHWDGAAWSATSVPGGGNTGTYWRVVSGASADDVWLSGMTCFAAYKAGGCYSVNARWNGSTWIKPVAPTPPTEPTFTTGAWARGPDDLWMASPGPYPELLPTTLTPQDSRAIRHWDGTAWSGTFGGSRASLFAIAGSGADLWAVGAQGTILRKRFTPAGRSSLEAPRAQPPVDRAPR